MEEEVKEEKVYDEDGSEIDVVDPAKYISELPISDEQKGMLLAILVAHSRDVSETLLMSMAQDDEAEARVETLINSNEFYDMFSNMLYMLYDQCFHEEVNNNGESE